MEQTLDCRGMACPMPVVQTKKALDAFSGEGTLRVLLNDAISVQNVSKFAQSRSLQAVAEKQGEKEYTVRIAVPSNGHAVPTTAATAMDTESAEETISCGVDARRRGTVLVLASQTVGTGDDTLGKKLMKGFLYAVSQQDVLPETVLCYNGGALLTCEGSPVLEELRALEAKGVNIETCGTCLEYYDIVDKLRVGSVTDSYGIAGRQLNASVIIRP